MITHAELVAEIEPFVDEASVQAVLEALAEICSEKSEHIRANWQDKDLALRWERASNLIATLTIKLGIIKAPGITE